MMPNEKPSEYIGTRMRPEGNSSGWVRVNQPMREKYSSSACSISALARIGDAARDPRCLLPIQSFVFATMFFGMRTMLS